MIPCTSPTTICPAIGINCGMMPARKPGSCPSIVGICVTILPSIGSRLPVRNVLMLSPSACICGVMSLPSAKFAIRSVAAAFMDANEPEKVVAASAAVVPVMPRSVWMT